jgi:hypothetical protein
MQRKKKKKKKKLGARQHIRVCLWGFKGAKNGRKSFLRKNGDTNEKYFD